MKGVLREKVIDLDPSKINIPSGLKLKVQPHATITLEKNNDYYYVKLSIENLGISKNLSVGADNIQYAESRFDMNVDEFMKGEYEISYHPRFSVRTTEPFNVEEI